MYRNRVIFRNIKCNPTHVMELANKIFHETLLYHKRSDLIDVSSMSETNKTDAGKAFKVNYWDPPPILTQMIQCIQNFEHK